MGFVIVAEDGSVPIEFDVTDPMKSPLGNPKKYSF